MGFFRWDSPLMRALTNVYEYMFLWFLCIVFSIPVITTGAAVTAKYTVAMKKVRGEDPQIFKSFVQAFKENFKQSTILFVIQVVVGLILIYDWMLIIHSNNGQFEQFPIALVVLCAVFVMSSIAIYPLIGRFEIKTFEAIKGAFSYTIIKLPQMILTVVLLIAPYLLAWWHMEWFVGILPVTATATLYSTAAMFVKGFKKVEERVKSDENPTENESESEEEDDTKELSDENISNVTEEPTDVDKEDTSEETKESDDLTENIED